MPTLLERFEILLCRVKSLEQTKRRDAKIKKQNKQKISALTLRIGRLEQRLEKMGRAANPPKRINNNKEIELAAKMQAKESLIEEGQKVGRYQKNSLWWNHTRQSVLALHAMQ